MRGRGVRLGLLLAASVVLTGCGAFYGTVTQSVGASSCEEIHSGACHAQVEIIAARHPGATQIDLRCTVRPCDRRGGSGTAIVTMPDGTTVRDVFTYVGAQGAVPAPICKGLPMDVCQSVADGRVDEISPSKVIVAIEITCIAAACTANTGEADVTVTLADGSRQESNVGWEGAQP